MIIDRNKIEEVFCDFDLLLPLWVYRADQYFLEITSEDRRGAEKDNRTVYLEPVPNPDTLEPITLLPAVPVKANVVTVRKPSPLVHFRF